jgi:endoglucanase
MHLSQGLRHIFAVLTTISIADSLPTADPSLSGDTLTPRSSKLQHVGVNIAGFDFGCTIDGTCLLLGNGDKATPPGQNGIDQMGHFMWWGLNTFRLPINMQYLTNNVLGGAIVASQLTNYDELVHGCLYAGNATSMCIIDIHNYARWNGNIIGQSGSAAPTDAQSAEFWRQLAVKCKDETRVIFSIMNEPHDLVMGTWVNTVQAAVTAIRGAGAKEQMILLPGTNYQSAGEYAANSGGLTAIMDGTGNTDKLILDVHQCLDQNYGGKDTTCVRNGIDDSFQPLATWGRSVGRKVFVSETGGGNNQGGVDFLKQTLGFFK